MSISDRYRQILEQIETTADELYESLPETATKALYQTDRAAEEMQDEAENVGEIPQSLLESRLSPVLLRAHSHLDRSRVLLEEGGFKEAGERIWQLEQLIYRLLNDL